MPRAVSSVAICRADMPALFNSARIGAICRALSINATAPISTLIIRPTTSLGSVAPICRRLQKLLELLGKLGQSRHQTRLGRDGSIRLCAQAAPRLSR
jgi:hypothetical protein